MFFLSAYSDGDPISTEVHQSVNKPAHWISMCCYSCVLTKVDFSVRFIERPNQRIALDDFKSFLLDSQKVITLGCWTCLLGGFVSLHVAEHLCLRFQEVWSTDNNKVQEFMFSYLKDPLREVEQPYFHQDEVHAHSLITSPFHISYFAN